MHEALSAVTESGMVVVEGMPGRVAMRVAADVDRLLESCFEVNAEAALLYAENLPATFFDLSSGDAGVILQKLRQYGVRLAVIRQPDSVAASSRFGEMVAEERTRQDFGVFGSHADARRWVFG